MKKNRVAPQQRIRRFLEIHSVLILCFVVACNSPQVQKTLTDDNWRIPSGRSFNDQLALVVQILQQKYVDTFCYLPYQDTSIAAILGRLDPYSSFLSKKANAQFNADFHDDACVIRFGFREATINDTPFVYGLDWFSICRKNGLCIGDQLLALDGISLDHRTDGFKDSLFASSNDLHYTLTILRPGETATRTLDVRKSAIPGDSRFCAFMLDSTTAYLWFNCFDKGIATRVPRELQLMRTLNPRLSNLVIDLRWNSGGYVDEAVALLSLFYVPDNSIIEVRSETHPGNNYKYGTTRLADFSDLGLVVLTNETSCSAAELFAGTLQDWDRALILGQQTCGKGLVMQKQELPDGSALYFTTARCYLPSGRCIQIPYKDGIQMAQQPESDKIIYNFQHREEKQYRCNDRSFFSKNGRPLFDQMGIIPDVLIPGSSNDYAIGKLRRDQLFGLECELIRRYQKLLIENSTFELFEKNFPVKEAVKYIGTRLKEITHEHFQSEKITALVYRLIFHIQCGYYGIGTQTAETLKSDNIIAEARRIIAVEALSVKKVLAANSPKESSTKNSRIRKAKKLAVK
jgi:carboxyl-terminal processing protease